jgi:hypothetical protein
VLTLPEVQNLAVHLVLAEDNLTLVDGEVYAELVQKVAL